MSMLVFFWKYNIHVSITQTFHWLQQSLWTQPSTSEARDKSVWLIFFWFISLQILSYLFMHFVNLYINIHQENFEKVGLETIDYIKNCPFDFHWQVQVGLPLLLLLGFFLKAAKRLSLNLKTQIKYRQHVYIDHSENRLTATLNYFQKQQWLVVN